MTVLVYETDLGLHLNKTGGFTNLKWKSGEEMVSIELDKVSSASQTNPVLIAEVQEKSWPIVKKEAESLVKDLKKADSIVDKGKREAAADKALTEFRKDAGAKLQRCAMDVFEVYIKDKGDYRLYLGKAGVRLLIDASSFAAAAVLTAASSWTGIGTAVGAVSMARSAGSIIQQFGNLAADAETIQEQIRKNAEKLERQLTGGQLGNTVKQGLSAIINAVTATEIENAFVTVEGLEKDFKLLESKVKGLHTNAASLGADLPKLLDAFEKIAPSQEILADLVKLTGEKTSDYKKFTAELADVEKNIKKAVEGASDLMERVRTLQKWTDDRSDMVADMKKKYKEGAVKVTKVLAQFVTLGLAFYGGNWTDATSTIAGFKSSHALGAALAVANDGLSTVKEMGTELFDAFKKKKV
ncbi:MAG TPA: hypothetical protein VFF72_11575 [Caldimonas sp.]|nr:hypothetical protein [Caldimonas sp.]